jgi:hypothetical protein
MRMKPLGFPRSLGRPWWRVLLAGVAIAFLSRAPLRGATVAPVEVTAVRLRPSEVVQRFWHVTDAHVDENFHSFEASVRVANIAGVSIRDALFYGEYKDGSGRLCFEILFRLAENREKRNGPVGPGETRTLSTISNNIGPATQALSLKLELISQEPTPSLSEGLGMLTYLRAPVTVAGLGESPGRWNELCLGNEYTRDSPPLVDVGLVRIHTSARGVADQIVVIDALAKHALKNWLEEFAARLPYVPASEGRTPTSGDSLLLVREFVREWRQGDPSLLPRSNPWVSGYVAGLQGGSVPPINSVLLFPDQQISTESPRNALPADHRLGCPWYSGVGTYWSEGVQSLRSLLPKPPRRSK